MIAIKSIRILHLLSYVLVTSQVLFYLFILCKALKAVSLENYFELRKVIDSLMIKRFKFMYYSCLALKYSGRYCICRTAGFALFYLFSVCINFSVNRSCYYVKG